MLKETVKQEKTNKQQNKKETKKSGQVYIFHFNTHNVGAAWTECEGAAGVDVRGVQELQHTDEVGAVGLRQQHRHKNRNHSDWSRV